MLVGVKTVATAFPGSGGHMARYLDNVMNALRTVQTDVRFAVFTTPDNHDAYEGWTRVPVTPPASTSLRGLFGRSDGLEGPLKQAKADVVLAPLSDPHLGNTPQVLYALDVAPWEKDAPPPVDEVADVRSIKKAISSARALVLTSEYLRRRCLELFDAPLNKSIVAPPGVNPALQAPGRTIIQEPYIVIFADALSYHVLPHVQKMMEVLSEEYPHSYVVVGPPHRMGEPWGDDVVRIEKLPDSQLAGLYQHASVFVNPAVHDGSALRTIEALYAGVPVVCARSGATVELAGQTPVYYNPASVDSMIQAMRRMLEADEKERADRINFGRQGVSRYKWEDTAWKVLGALNKK
jgi:glycosyltransferase involved in cell wall biosynthesis